MKELTRTKQGQFTLEEHALPEEKWTLEHILETLLPCPEAETDGKKPQKVKSNGKKAPGAEPDGKKPQKVESNGEKAPEAEPDGEKAPEVETDVKKGADADT